MEKNRKQITVNLSLLSADTIKYFLLYSVDGIHKQAAKRGGYTAGENRLMNAFNDAVQQIELTDTEEELAEAIAEEMDKNYNLSKKN